MSGVPKRDHNFDSHPYMLSYPPGFGAKLELKEGRFGIPFVKASEGGMKVGRI